MGQVMNRINHDLPIAIGAVASVLYTYELSDYLSPFYVAITALIVNYLTFIVTEYLMNLLNFDF